MAPTASQSHAATIANAVLRPMVASAVPMSALHAVTAAMRPISIVQWLSLACAVGLLAGLLVGRGLGGRLGPLR